MSLCIVDVGDEGRRSGGSLCFDSYFTLIFDRKQGREGKGRDIRTGENCRLRMGGGILG